jgi:hypothetical protein
MTDPKPNPMPSAPQPDVTPTEKRGGAGKRAAG